MAAASGERGRRVVVAALVVALAAPGAGCSFLFVTPPKAKPTLPPRYPECTDSRVWPTLDFLHAGFQLYWLGFADRGRPLVSRSTDDLVWLLLGTVAFASGVYGVHETSECKRVEEQARKAYEDYFRGRRAMAEGQRSPADAAATVAGPDAGASAD